MVVVLQNNSFRAILSFINFLMLLPPHSLCEANLHQLEVLLMFFKLIFSQHPIPLILLLFLSPLSEQTSLNRGTAAIL